MNSSIFLTPRRSLLVGLVVLCFAYAPRAAEPAPASGGQTNVQSNTDHRIEPQDVIAVDVFQEKDLSRELTVSAEGEVLMPLLGSIKVAGRTTAEVKTDLEQRLGADFLVNPSVIVSVRQYRKRTVTVLGQVFKSGTVELTGEQRIDLLEAIGQAGGPTRLANPKKVEVSRKGKTERVNLEDLRKNPDPNKKYWLEPGDVIFVPETVF